MKTTSNIEDRLPKHDGMTVPEGYFENFALRMEQALPDRSDVWDESKQRSLWQRIRPYVYMAAMFAGVWCMLKMFTLMADSSPVPMEMNPIVAEAFNNEAFVNDYLISDINQWDLYDDLIGDGINPDSFLDSIALSQMDVPADLLK